MTILSGKTRRVRRHRGARRSREPPRYAAAGTDLSELYPIVPAPLPWTPPYQLAGELAHGKGLWTFRRFKEPSAWETDLSGDFKVDVSSRRARTTADLKSTKFDYYDLGGFIGLPPGDAARAKTPAQQAEVSRRAKSARASSAKRLDFTGMHEYDVEVKFQGTAVQWAGIPMENLRAYLKLENGVLRFQPLDFGVAGGHVVSSIVLDVNPAVAKAQVQIDARGVELKRIFPRLAAPGGSAGRFAGRARFNAEGEQRRAARGAPTVMPRYRCAAAKRARWRWCCNLDLARAAEAIARRVTRRRGSAVRLPRCTRAAARAPADPHDRFGCNGHQRRRYARPQGRALRPSPRAIRSRACSRCAGRSSSAALSRTRSSVPRPGRSWRASALPRGSPCSRRRSRGCRSSMPAMRRTSVSRWATRRRSKRARRSASRARLPSAPRRARGGRAVAHRCVAAVTARTSRGTCGCPAPVGRVLRGCIRSGPLCG